MAIQSPQELLIHKLQAIQDAENQASQAIERLISEVENEELRDLNDALELQVTELKNVVDKQPAEVEEKLRLEMERIMKRNI